MAVLSKIQATDSLADGLPKINEAFYKIDAIESVALVRLVDVAGSPDAITANVPVESAPVDITTGSYVLLRPTATNTIVNPTLTINGGIARRLRSEMGGDLGVGQLVADAMHVIYIASNGAALVMGVFLKPSELPLLRKSLSDTTALATALSAVVNDVASRPVLAYALQTTAALPSRPDAPVVHWLTWTDPTGLMGPADMWFKLPEPTVPDMPKPEHWAFLDAKSGSSAVVRITSVPASSPPITSIQYRVDGGTWVSVPAAPAEFVIEGLTLGQTYGAELRYVNFVGYGIPTTVHTVKISDGAFSDTFTRSNSYVSADPRWLDVVVGQNGRKANVLNNAAQPAGTNETYVVQANEYFPADQFAEAQIIGTGSNTTNSRGVYLYVRMAAAKHSGYRLRLAGASWTLSRVIDGSIVVLASGTHTNVAPYQARLVAVGHTVTAYVAGTVLATVTDSDPAAHLAGTVGFGFNAAGADGVSSVCLDNFAAGKV